MDLNVWLRNEKGALLVAVECTKSHYFRSKYKGESIGFTFRGDILDALQELLLLYTEQDSGDCFYELSRLLNTVKSSPPEIAYRLDIFVA